MSDRVRWEAEYRWVSGASTILTHETYSGLTRQYETVLADPRQKGRLGEVVVRKLIIAVESTHVLPGNSFGDQP